MKDVLVHDFTFLSNEKPPAVASADSGLWRSKITGSGPPTVQAVAAGMALALEATEEVQNACLYFGDILSLDIDDIQSIDIWAKVSSATLAATVSMAIGLTSARNDAIDSITEAALFRVLPTGTSNTVVVETDDGTNDNDDKATGLTLSTTVRRFNIDFSSGVQTVAPPGVSKGGKGNVLFSMENSAGLLVPVARSVLFDMSNYAGGLQVLAQVQKTSATAVGTLTIPRIRVRRKFG